MAPTITRKQAQVVLERLHARYRYDIFGMIIEPEGPDDEQFVMEGLAEIDHPKLTEGRNAGTWEIVWEAGPFEWSYNFTMGGIDEETAAEVLALGGQPIMHQPVKVANIHLESINTYTVGIYPE